MIIAYFKLWKPLSLLVKLVPSGGYIADVTVSADTYIKRIPTDQKVLNKQLVKRAQGLEGPIHSLTAGIDTFVHADHQ